jgi:hypothetical protein
MAPALALMEALENRNVHLLDSLHSKTYEVIPRGAKDPHYIKLAARFKNRLPPPLQRHRAVKLNLVCIRPVTHNTPKNQTKQGLIAG